MRDERYSQIGHQRAEDRSGSTNFDCSVSCLSGIDEQMWQVIPAVVFFVLWLIEMVVWEGAECVIEWLE